MQDAFELVIFVVVILSAIVAVVGLAARNSAYDEIGRGGLSIDRLPPDPPATRALRDVEIRQMLEAANGRRLRRGRPPLDVEAELARLVGVRERRADPQLEAEIRALVRARNERRARRGLAPLDVEAELRRHL